MRESRRKVPLIVVIIALQLTGMVALAGWDQQNSGTTRNLNSITAFHGNVDFAWACGDSGVIVRTMDGGLSWQSMPSGTTHNLNSIAFIASLHSSVMAVGDSGTVLHTSDGGESAIATNPPDRLPQSSVLGQCFPNPFNSTTTVSYTLKSAGSVTATIYDELGREVPCKPTGDLGSLPAGTHQMAIDGGGLASGIYFLRLAAGEGVMTRKIMLMK